jgi:hypothetical protein
MAPGDIFSFVFATVVTGALVGVARYLSPANKLKRQLRRLPRRTLAELAEGTSAHVTGKAEGLDDPLEAPLSGRRCLYYVAIVAVSKGRSTRQLIREERGVPFILDDGTARAIIDPSGCKAVLDFDSRSSSGTFDNPTPRELAFLLKHGASARDGILGYFNRDLHYREAVIEAGERIAIIGEAVREPDPDGTPEAAYRGDAPTRLRMTSSVKQPMIISDIPSVTREA